MSTISIPTMYVMYNPIVPPRYSIGPALTSRPSSFFAFSGRFVRMRRLCRLGSLRRVPGRLPRPLLQQRLLAVVQESSLVVVDALEPVSEARAACRVEGVDPEGALVEEWAHLDADLPEAHAQAYHNVKKYWSAILNTCTRALQLCSRRCSGKKGLAEAFSPKRLQKAMRCTIVTMGCVDEPGSGSSVESRGMICTERLTLTGNPGS